MKKLKFVRYGGLSPVKQTQYSTEPESFHTPPRRKGNYAFPYLFVDKFLLGATDHPGHVSNKVKWLKDENGNKITYGEFFDEYDETTDKLIVNKKYRKLLKKLKVKMGDIGYGYHNKNDENVSYITVYKKPKIFDYNGEIWHHLGNHLKPHQIIEVSGSWVKSDMEDYIIAFNLETRECKREMLKITKGFKTQLKDQVNIHPLKNFFSKDHLEVFIEKIK